MNCAICNRENPAWAWTDTHGIAQCFICGTPYRLYHYEGDTTKRIDKPPELCVKDEYIPALQAYWQENHRTIPGGFSFPGGQEMASREDERFFYDWIKSHADKVLPERVRATP